MSLEKNKALVRRYFEDVLHNPDACIAHGRIAEIWDISDRLWMWRQLGVLPELQEAIAEARGAVSCKDPD